MAVLSAPLSHQVLVRVRPAVVEDYLEGPTPRPQVQVDSEVLGKLLPLLRLALAEETQEAHCLEAIRQLVLVEPQALQHLVEEPPLVHSAVRVVVHLERQHLLLYQEERESVKAPEVFLSRLTLRKNPIAPPTSKTLSRV